MVKDQTPQESTVIATYWTRRDAEIARDYLDGSGISAFIRSDDAGGMHPQLQWSHGVHLVVLGDAVQDAHKALDAANLLPESREDLGEEAGDPVADATKRSGIRTLLWILALLAAVTAAGLLLR